MTNPLEPESLSSPESPRGWCEWFVGLPAAFLIAGVRLYQLTLSPIVGRQCRFHPTCSHYFIGAVKKYGAVRGSLKGVWRICRCNPFCSCGDDPP